MFRAPSTGRRVEHNALPDATLAAHRPWVRDLRPRPFAIARRSQREPARTARATEPYVYADGAVARDPARVRGGSGADAGWRGVPGGTRPCAGPPTGARARARDRPRRLAGGRGWRRCRYPDRALH